MHFDQTELLYVLFKILIHDSNLVVITKCGPHILSCHENYKNGHCKNGKSLCSSCNFLGYSTSTSGLYPFSEEPSS